MAASLRTQLVPSHAHLDPLAATNCGQAASDNDLHQSPYQAPKQQTQWLASDQNRHNLISSTSNIPKGRSWQALDPTVPNSTFWGSHLHSSSYTVVGPILIVSQSDGHITYTRDTPKAPSCSVKETVPLSPTGHLLHKAMLTRLRDIADVPST